MRNIAITFLTIGITSAIALFLFHREEVSEVIDNKATVGGLEKTTPLSEIEDPPSPYEGEGGRGERLCSDSSCVAHLEAADKYLDEALPLTDYKQRFVLIEKINGFQDSYKLAINPSGSDPDGLMRATARYIASWSPFYYYIHPDAQAILGPLIKMLESERAGMLEALAQNNAKIAGQFASEDVEYYIEDIRKSAARRNSDFITFSIADYERYRKNFDALAQRYPEFLFGFAEQAHILFDDFYRMHEEVNQDYLDKTRKKAEDVRLELRDLHKEALREFAKFDSQGAQEALVKTISLIENELSAHPDWRAEIYDIMKSDYEFYKGIVINP